MTLIRLPVLLAAPFLALGALSGCATGFRADVARFQQLPPAQGQSFTIQADDPHLAGGLEFGHYADLVAERLVEKGYTRAVDPAAAQLVVRLDYSVDNGRERVQASAFSPAFSGYYNPWFYSGYRGWGGWRGRYAFGFNDPYLFGGGYGDIDSYTVYSSQLSMKIDRTGGERLFEGVAKAQSTSDHLTYLVPNLIDAMFTGFPGNSGEEVKVTVGPEPK